MNKSKIAVIIAMIACMFIPAFKLTTAIENTKAYNLVRSNVKDLNESLTTIDDRIETHRKELNELRGDTINAEDCNDLYAKITSLPGITSTEASALSITGETIKIKGEFNSTADNSGLDGIQLILVVDNVSNFITELSKFNLTYESINVISAEKKIILNLNTKGGV